jgi:peptidoglycan/LPS O-acetylase OafA/YrhL
VSGRLRHARAVGLALSGAGVALLALAAPASIAAGAVLYALVERPFMRWPTAPALRRPAAPAARARDA